MIKHTSPEIRFKHQAFKKGDIITCPSDGTGHLWKVIEKNNETKNIKAKLVEGQNPSKHYPKEIQISPEAQDKWQKL